MINKIWIGRRQILNDRMSFHSHSLSVYDIKKYKDLLKTISIINENVDDLILMLEWILEATALKIITT